MYNLSFSEERFEHNCKKKKDENPGMSIPVMVVCKHTCVLFDILFSTAGNIPNSACNLLKPEMFLFPVREQLSQE